jgi:plasmid replication initiation protein
MATKKLSKVQKSNELNQANFSDFSLSCYRVLLTLISQIQRHDMSGNQLSLPVVNRTCSLSASTYAKEFNLDGNTAYEILKEATDKLMKTSFSIRMDFGIRKINVCSQADYKSSQGRIDIRFTEEIMPHLAELGEKFTMYNLNEVAGFDSIYTTRLYELIMQFKTTGELKTSVADLRFKLGCVNKFKQYYDFKLKTFAHAIEEINQQWTLDIQFEEIKKGRTVTDLIFTFKPTFTRKAYDPIRQKMRTQLTRPKKKELSEKEILDSEAKRIKQTEYRERHKAKKQLMKDLEREHLLNSLNPEDFDTVHPDQLELGL